MKSDKLIFSICSLIFLIVGLNFRFGNIPPLAKIVNPFSGFIQNDKDYVLQETDNLQLDSEVKIYYDQKAIPHIFATTERDMYFMQGYTHASERIWQMDFLMRVASGRLSEIFGDLTIDNDKEFRRKGLYVSAESSLKFIIKNHPQTYRHFEAYSNGVNKYIKELKAKNLPIEFKLLDYEPENWSPLKTILIQKYMADMLSGFDNDAEKSNALNYFGKQKYEELYYKNLLNTAPMIDSISSYYSANKNSSYLNSSLVNKVASNRYIYSQPEKFKTKPGHGSNTWVVDSKKSASGYPILANDPHLNLTLPSIWYEIQLSSNKSNSYGVSIPGLPYIMIGFNENIAWGVTNGVTDVKDWYALKFKNNNQEYLLNGKWLKADKRVEKISVFGSTDVFDTIYTTILGPVFSVKEYNNNFKNISLAMNWSGTLPSNDFNAFYLLNNAKNYTDYLNAVKFLDCPNLNISFASKTEIAISHQGKIPVREGDEGELIYDQDAAIDSLFKFIPKDLLPVQKNPEKGFVFSCNQVPVAKNYPYSLYGFYELHRNRIAEKELSKNKRFTLSDMMDLQLDNYDLFASEALPVMLEAISTCKIPNKYKSLIDSLRVWNYRNNKNSYVPTIFHNWWFSFHKETWDEISSFKTRVLMPDQTITLDLLKNNLKNKWFDVKLTTSKESAKEVLIKTLFDELSYYVEGKNSKENLWGIAKNTKFDHLAKISAFSSERIPTDGFSGSLNAITHDHGPGWRMIVAFNINGPEGFGINPGGQSGNPGSSYYNSGINDWANGKYYKLKFIRDIDSCKLKKVVLK